MRGREALHRQELPNAQIDARRQSTQALQQRGQDDRRHTVGRAYDEAARRMPRIERRSGRNHPADARKNFSHRCRELEGALRRNDAFWRFQE